MEMGIEREFSKGLLWAEGTKCGQCPAQDKLAVFGEIKDNVPGGYKGRTRGFEV